MFGTPPPPANTAPAASAASAGAPYPVVEATEASFMKDVIDASLEVPVLVDFYSARSAPSKTFGATLEAAVAAARGRVRLVRINIDTARQLAAQLRIQSLPSVFAFWQGKPADGFQGILGPAELKKFVDQMADLAGPVDNGLADAVDAAEAMLAEGAFADAIETFAAILEEEPLNATAYGGLIRAQLASGDIDMAQSLADAAPATLAKAKEIEAARALIALARQAATAGPEADLRAALAQDPKNPQHMFDLSTALHAAGKIEEAVALLLDLFGQNRDWNEGAAKTQLFIIFGALKPQDPIVLQGRRRLSSMIFA